MTRWLLVVFMLAMIAGPARAWLHGSGSSGGGGGGGGGSDAAILIIQD